MSFHASLCSVSVLVQPIFLWFWGGHIFFLNYLLPLTVCVLEGGEECRKGEVVWHFKIWEFWGNFVLMALSSSPSSSFCGLYFSSKWPLRKTDQFLQSKIMAHVSWCFCLKGCNFFQVIWQLSLDILKLPNRTPSDSFSPVFPILVRDGTRQPRPPCTSLFSTHVHVSIDQIIQCIDCVFSLCLEQR